MDYVIETVDINGFNAEYYYYILLEEYSGQLEQFLRDGYTYAGTYYEDEERRDVLITQLIYPESK